MESRLTPVCRDGGATMRRIIPLSLILTGSAIGAACAKAPVTPPIEVADVAQAPTFAAAATRAIEGVLTVDSPAFSAGGNLPPKYTAEGDNVSPPLNWSDGPK